MNPDLWKSRFKEYLELRYYSPRSVAGYTAELDVFFRFLEAQGVESLAAITREVMEEYRAFLFEATHRGKRISASTQAHRLSTVKVFTRFLAREKFIAIDPGAGVELPRLPQTLPRHILSENEAEQVVETSEGVGPLDIRNRAILEVLYCTAIRNQELRDLRVEDVALDCGEVCVQRGKGAKGRMLPLGDDAVDWLKEYLAHSRPYLVRSTEQMLLFLTCRGNRLGRSELARLVRGIGRKAGVKKAVTPHVLRHSCATHMLRHGAGLRQLQELMGHASPETTQRYTRVEVSDLRRVLKRCHPRERKA